MDSEVAEPIDVEGNKSEQGFLLNETVHRFSWQKLTVAVKDRQTKLTKDLICNVNGDVEQGLSVRYILRQLSIIERLLQLTWS
jgi:hypothetical protein